MSLPQVDGGKFVNRLKPLVGLELDMPVVCAVHGSLFVCFCLWIVWLYHLYPIIYVARRLTCSRVRTLLGFGYRFPFLGAKPSRLRKPIPCSSCWMTTKMGRSETSQRFFGSCYFGGVKDGRLRPPKFSWPENIINQVFQKESKGCFWR